MTRISENLQTTPAITCMKLLLNIFNFFFWISGIAILALGIWMKVELYKYMELTTIYYSEAPYVLIGVGCVITVVGMLACCCTVKGKPVLLYTYAVFLVVVFVAELSVGIAAFAYKGKLEEGFRVGMKDAMGKYRTLPVKAQAIDGMQKGLQCCGQYNFTEWWELDWYKEGKYNDRVPSSCCRSTEQNCDPSKVSDIYTDGCYVKVTSFTKSYYAIIAGVIIAFAFIMLLGSMFSCCLAKNINKCKYEQVA